MLIYRIITLIPNISPPLTTIKCSPNPPLYSLPLPSQTGTALAIRNESELPITVKQAGVEFELLSPQVGYVCTGECC